VLAGARVITILVLPLVLLAFRGRRARDAVVQDVPGASGAARDALAASERRWLLGGGVLFPAVVLAALLATGVVLGERAVPRGRAALVVHAEATRWHWTFRYPGSGLAATRDELHIPAGTPVDVVITTTDVIHSFWIPRLAGKLDAIPGHPNRLRIEAERPGRFAGQCAEFCGVGHATHGFAVIAHDAAGWAAHRARDGAP
jgi:heme/copper-type cytochrome/quinol oxidase subunit 2